MPRNYKIAMTVMGLVGVLMLTTALWIAPGIPLEGRLSLNAFGLLFAALIVGLTGAEAGL